VGQSGGDAVRRRAFCARGGLNKAVRVFLVMDAHDVYSAQRNVARLLARLGIQGKMVVGVEGTSGEFDLERHRGLLPGVGQSHLVDHLLKKGFLNGSEAFGLTAERTPDLWGVETPALYEANVRAYRETLGLETETRSALDSLKKETLAQQANVFSREMLALDQEVRAMHDDRGDLGRYVKAVVSGDGRGKLPLSSAAVYGGEIERGRSFLSSGGTSSGGVY
jgi:hypothetical protein